MGNKMSLELKEGRPCLEIEESLVRDFQDRIFSTDKAMSGFVKAIDSMEAACEELHRKLPKGNGTTEEKDVDCDLNDEQRAAKLLWTIKECVSDHKFVVLECMSKFMKLVIETGKGYIDYPSDLSIDKYRQSHEVGDKPYYDTRIEMLLKEIDLLKQKYKDEIEETAEYEAVKLNFSNQQEKYHKRIDELEKTVDNISSENAKLNEQIAVIKTKLDSDDMVNDEMKTEMKSSPIFLKLKLDHLQRDMELMNQKYKMETEKLKNLKEKEKIYSKETARYLRRIGELDKEVDNLVSMNNDLDDKLRYALLKLENQSIDIDVLKRREKIAKEDYEEQSQKADEYKTQIKNFFDEIVSFNESLTSEIENKVEMKSGTQESDVILQLQLESKECGAKESNKTSDFNNENNKIDKQMGKIKDQLKYLKEMIEKCNAVNNQDTREEWQIVNDAEDCKEKDTEIEKSVSKMSILQEENQALKREIKTLKEKQILHVQVYFMYGVKKASTEENTLIGMLHKSISFMSAELHIDVLTSPSEAYPGLPLLIFQKIFYSYSEWGKSHDPNLLDMFELSAKMALVTFHYKEKSIFTTSKSEADQRLQKLGGLFDFGYKPHSIYFVFDECGINEIIAFIRRNNPRKYQDTHFLGR